MTEAIQLKTLRLGVYPDREKVQMRFLDEEENVVVVELPSNQMRGVIAELMSFTMSLQVDEALAPDSDALATPSQTLSAIETALLPIRQIGVVRWRKGGAILKVTTHTGVGMQLALSPTLRAGLQEALVAELPSE